MVASRRLGADGPVIAFEPNQKIFRNLNYNLTTNGCTNIDPECAGVSNATAREALNSYSAYHSRIAHINEMGSSTVMVLGGPQIADLILDVAAG